MPDRTRAGGSPEVTDGTTAGDDAMTGGERYLYEQRAVRVAELEEALRGLIKCHGMPPAKDCGYLRAAKEVLGEF